METKVYELDPTEPDLAKVREAAELVDAGKLVAFPTETVYGIASRVAAEPLVKLSNVKGRQDGKYYTLHIAEKSELSKYVPSPDLRAVKLAANAWPGPLTLVFELGEQDLRQQKTAFEKDVFEYLYKDSSIGIRCPDHAVAKALLKATNNPVVAPSANITGHPPPVDAAAVLAQLAGKVELVLDAGPCRYKTSSTVAKIGKKGIEILRPGACSARELEAKAQVKFLFVCTGNTCRSPMAAGIFAKYLAEKTGCELDQLEEKGYKILSAGTMGMVGAPATAEAVAACAAGSVDIGRHSSSALSAGLIADCDLVFAMTHVHRENILALSPAAAGKCLMLAENTDIPDPIGQPQRIYNDCAQLIEKAVNKRIGELAI